MGQIKSTTTNELYQKASDGSRKKKETNDCAVKAVSIACEVDYDKIHEIMKKHGRKDKDGTWRETTRKTLKELRWRMEYIDQRKFKRRFPKHHSELKYITSHSFRRFPEAFEDIPKIVLAFTAGHVFAVMDGQNCDWSVNNKLRIKGMYELVPDWEQLSELPKEAVIDYVD